MHMRNVNKIQPQIMKLQLGKLSAWMAQFAAIFDAMFAMPHLYIQIRNDLEILHIYVRKHVLLIIYESFCSRCVFRLIIEQIPTSLYCLYLAESTGSVDLPGR